MMVQKKILATDMKKENQNHLSTDNKKYFLESPKKRIIGNWTEFTILCRNSTAFK